MTVILILAAMTLFVAYSNGANDNFKGVATLYAADVTSYEKAITIGTLATFAGCIASVFLAEALVQAFSGRGLVPDAVADSPIFLAAVATGTGTTVILATFLGLPVSTTHGLTGALIGAGFVAAGTELNLDKLGTVFFLPLLVSPLLSILITMPLYKAAHAVTQWMRITKTSCVCISPGHFVPLAQYPATCYLSADAIGNTIPTSANITLGKSLGDCVSKYDGRVLGITAQSLVDGVHYLSAATVSFARGLNDTPKIIGLLLVVKALDLKVSMLAVAVAMAIGGWLNARKVAQTMGKKISQMNDGQALTANLVTAFMVIFASKLGVPVSTTHVSVGAITGIGLVNGSADKGVIGGILLAWILVLPTAAISSAACYLVLAAL